MPVSNWSTTAASNGATLGIDIAENCDAANVNNALREMMAQLKTKIDAMDALITAGSLGDTLTALEAVTTAANTLIYATGVDTFTTTTLSSFARTLIDDGDAATALNTLGAIYIIDSSISATSGYIKFGKSGAALITVQWVDGTAAGNATTVISYPTAFSSWSRAICGGGSTDAASEDNEPRVTSSTTTGASVSSSRVAAHTVWLWAWGV